MENKDLFLKELAKSISYKSYQRPAKDGMPFGEGVDGALKHFLSLCSSFGFEVKNYDGYMGEAIFGEGEEIGIIGHLDVVPEGDGWLSDPYTLTERDGYLYARGILDDKAPLLMCVFAVKELMDKGVKFNRKLRIFAGCNEESGWKDVEYFKTKSTFPKWGFSPDGDFPVSYAEKGPNRIIFEFPLNSRFSSFTGGTVVNAVCAYASVVGPVNKELLEKHGLTFDGEKIESIGKAAHGAYPELGKNAILPILKYMADMGEDVQNIIDLLFDDKFGVKKMGNETGLATLSPNIVSQTENSITLTCDFRVPAKMLLSDFLPIFDKFGVKYTAIHGRDPLYVPIDSEIVVTLTNAYNKITGENREPISQRGATFASVFPCGVAFGPELPNVKATIHEPNECIKITDLEKMYNIYLNGIHGLVK